MDLAIEEQLLALFRLTRDRIQRIAERHAMTYQQLVALRHLSRSGPMTMSELTERIGVTRGAMTGLVDRLEEAGLVARRHGAEDRRVIFLDVTPHGGDVLAAMQASWQAETRQWIRKLDPGERALVSQVLGRLLEVGSASE